MCSYLNPVCDVGRIAGSAGSALAGSFFNQVAQAFGSAAAQVTSWMWTVIAQTTQVNLSGGWFTSSLGITATLAGVVIIAIYAIELIKAVLRREPGALARATVGVGAGLLGAAASIGVVDALLTVTDALSEGIVRTAGLGSVATLGAKIAPAGAIAGVGSPALILILGLGYLIASFFVWALFIGRKAMIIVAAVFAPVAFAGAASRATSGWVRKWIEFTLAMVFSKLVVVIIFTLALSLVGSPGTGLAAVGTLFSGLALMVLACFAPWMLFRLVHFVGGDVIAAHHQGLHQSVVAAGATPINMAKSGAGKVAGVVGGGSAGAAGGSGSGAATAAGGAGRGGVGKGGGPGLGGSVSPLIKPVTGSTPPAAGGEAAASEPGAPVPPPTTSGPPPQSAAAFSPSPENGPQPTRPVPPTAAGAVSQGPTPQSQERGWQWG